MIATYNGYVPIFFDILFACLVEPAAARSLGHQARLRDSPNSADTSEFAVDAIACWWRKEGIRAYPDADKLFILADS